MKNRLVRFLCMTMSGLMIVTSAPVNVVAADSSRGRVFTETSETTDTLVQDYRELNKSNSVVELEVNDLVEENKGNIKDIGADEYTVEASDGVASKIEVSDEIVEHVEPIQLWVDEAVVEASLDDVVDTASLDAESNNHSKFSDSDEDIDAEEVYSLNDDNQNPVVVPEYFQTAEIDLNDNNALLDGYLRKELGIMEEDELEASSSSINESKFSSIPVCLDMYRAVKAMAAEVANGERSDTKVYVDAYNTDDKEFIIKGTDLGLGKITDDNVRDIRNNYDLVNLSKSYLTEWKYNNFDAYAKDIFYAAKYDCPYEFYWSGLRYTYGTSGYSITGPTKGADGEYYMKISGAGGTKFQVVFGISASEDYVITESDIYTVDTAKTSLAKNVTVNAKAIVNEAKSFSDYDKLDYYLVSLCDLTDYNHDAAARLDAGAYGDPWQIIYLFDKDPSTKVVCEGYSKGFQYLCEMTDFDSEKIQSRIVTGNFGTKGGSLGAHMWNILTMDNGKNYLVDVTNCDQSTLTRKLFIVPHDGTGSSMGSYYYDALGRKMEYKYGEEMRNFYSTSELTITSDEYHVVAPHTVYFDYQIPCTDSDVVSVPVTSGKAYGELPKPRHGSCIFEGWFTDPKAGKQVTEYDIYALDTDQTLYARWYKKTLSSITNAAVTEDFANKKNILTWDYELSDGVEFFVEGYEDGAGWKDFGTVSTNHFDDTYPNFISKYEVMARRYSDVNKWFEVSEKTRIDSVFFPAPPSNLTYKQYGNVVKLSWDFSPDSIDNYNVCFKLDGSKSASILKTLEKNKNTWDVPAQAGQTGCYYVSSVKKMYDAKGNIYPGDGIKISQTPPETEVKLWEARDFKNNVSIDVSDCKYTGTPCKPSVTVTYIEGGRHEVLTEGVDYNVSYSNNAAAGTAYATINADGLEGIYYGTETESFTIYNSSAMIFDAGKDAFIIDSVDELLMFVKILSNTAVRDDDYTVEDVTGNTYYGEISEKAILNNDIDIEDNLLKLYGVSNAEIDLTNHKISSRNKVTVNSKNSNITFKNGQLSNVNTDNEDSSVVKSIDGNIIFDACTIDGSAKEMVNTDGAKITISQSTVKGKIATVAGELSIIDSTVKATENTINSDGTEILIKDSIIEATANSAIENQGSVCVKGITIDNSTVKSNTSWLSGGNIYYNACVEAMGPVSVINDSYIYGGSVGVSAFSDVILEDSKIESKLLIGNKVPYDKSDEFCSVAFLFQGTEENDVQIKNCEFRAGTAYAGTKLEAAVKTHYLGILGERLLSGENKNTGFSGARTKDITTFLASGQKYSRTLINNYNVPSPLYVDDGSVSHNPKIIYHLDGGVNDPDNLTEYEVRYDYFLYKPNPATREGCRFDGWYENDELIINGIDLSIEEDRHLYAHWTPVVNRVSKPEFKLDIYDEKEDGTVVVKKGTKLFISSATREATIQYTLDGSKPGEDVWSSFYYNEPVVIEENMNLKAIATKNGYFESEVASIQIEVLDESTNWGDVAGDEGSHEGFDSPEDIPELLWVRGVPGEVIYTGKAITFPELRVYSGKTLLKSGTDYTVQYKNNTNAGKATVTIKGKGNYSGSIVKNYKILPRELENNTTVYDVNTVYNGKVQKLVPTVIYTVSGNQIALKKGVDFKCQYYGTNKDDEDYEAGAFKDAGEYTIGVVGIGNYTGIVACLETINEKGSLVIDKMKFSSIPAQKYTGESVEPKVTVKNGSNPLVEGEDYSVEYFNNVGVGTAYALVTGEGDYTGKRVVAFKIKGTELKKVKFSGALTKAKIYTGAPINNVEEDSVYKVNSDGETEPLNGILKSEYTQMSDEEKLEYDYVYAFSSNVNVGTAKVVFTGVTGYTGSVTKKFKINKASISDDYWIDIEDAVYMKGGAKPAVRVYNDETELKAGKDFTVKYTNNTKVHSGEGSKVPTVKISGKGNYKGSIIGEFAIEKSSLDNVNITVNDFIAISKPGCKPSITIKDTDGKALKAGTDYNKSVIYKYATPLYGVKHKVDGGVVELDVDAGEVVANNAILPVGAEIIATITGKGNYPGEREAIFNVIKKDISKATVKVKTQAYTGGQCMPGKEDITVTISGKTVEPQYYEIVGYKNNIKKGTAQVIIRGINTYGGKKTANFTISAASMSYTVIYNKNDENATGTMKKSSLAMGGKVTKNAFKNSGYRFIGWSFEPGVQDVVIKNQGALVLPDTDNYGSVINLYAQWE